MRKSKANSKGGNKFRIPSFRDVEQNVQYFKNVKNSAIF